VKKTGAVLDPLLKNLGLESGVRLARIKHDWYAIFDEQITSNLFPVSFSDRELLLYVTSPIWMQQFSFHKSEIIKKLSTYGVQNIRFRLGRIPQKKQNIPARKAPELTPEKQIFITITVGYEHESLKETIKSGHEILNIKKPQQSD
jgi:hypothetical protein